MRRYAILLSAFLLAAANPAFAQEAAGPTVAQAALVAESAPADPSAQVRRSDPPLCFGFVVFDSDCDGPAAHLTPLPRATSQAASAATVK
jgi:hypothetical protein